MLMLDLRNLTDEMVAEARPHLGMCKYSAPCIIGTLIPADHRARLDNENNDLGVDDIIENPTVGQLVEHNLVEFPSERQAELANKLQTAFDNHGEHYDFDKTLAEVRKELSI